MNCVHLNLNGFLAWELRSIFVILLPKGVGLVGIGHNLNAEIFCGEVIYDFKSFFWMDSSFAGVHPILGWHVIWRASSSHGD